MDIMILISNKMLILYHINSYPEQFQLESTKLCRPTRGRIWKLERYDRALHVLGTRRIRKQTSIANTDHFNDGKKVGC